MINLVIFFLTGFGLIFGSEAVGAALLSRLGLPLPQRTPFLSFGLGCFLLVFCIITLGLLGYYNPLPLIVLWAVWLAIAAVRIFFFTPSWFRDVQDLIQQPDLLSILIRVSLLVLLLVMLSTAMTPETRHDPYDYHLSVPSLYLSYGKIVEIPWHVFSYMPKNGEMLYGWVLAVSNDSSAKLIHYLFGLMGVLLIAHWVTRWAHLEMGLFSAIMIVSLPLYGFLATSAYVDFIRAFWELMALYALYEVWDVQNSRNLHSGYLSNVVILNEMSEEKGSPSARLFLCFSALFAGMALGSKYVAWGVFLPPYLVLLAITVYSKGYWRWIPAVVFLMLLPVLPWMALNTIWTGNPLYPLFSSIFGMHSPAAAEAQQFFRDHAPASETFGLSEILPFISMRLGKLLIDGNSQILIGILALILSPWWRKNTEGRLMPHAAFWGINFYIVASSCLFILMTDNHDGRFFFSTIALLAIPITYFLHRFADQVTDERKWGIYVLPCIVLFFFFNAVSYRFAQLNDLKESLIPILRDSERSDYLKNRFSNYEVVEWANRNLDADAFVLGMGFPLQRKNIHGLKYGYVPFLLNVNADTPPPDLARILKTAGVTHIAEPFPVLKEGVDFSILKDSYLKPMRQFRGSILYELNGPEPHVS